VIEIDFFEDPNEDHYGKSLSLEEVAARLTCPETSFRLVRRGRSASG
jgi:hypothetical protein